MNEIRTFLTSVVDVADVHPQLRRITLAGGDLCTFAPLGPDTFVYLLLPPSGRRALTVDRSFTWERYEELPEALRPIGAYYTVRAWRPERAELDLMVVLHDPAGPASTWATRARAGDPAAVWGPRAAFAPPPGTTTFLLVADETGLPAVAAILESLTPEQRAVVVAEVADAGHRQPLLERDGITIHWVHRHGAPAGSVPHLMIEQVRSVALDDRAAYAWGGGESGAMTCVRDHLRRERGWDRDAVSMIGYWRLGTT